MDIVFIRRRITQLRMQQGISEYKMSLDLGHSRSYMQSISSGRTLPSLSEFLYICEYLKVSPAVFFQEDVEAPAFMEEMLSSAKGLSEEDLRLLLDLIKRLKNEKV